MGITKRDTKTSSSPSQGSNNSSPPSDSSSQSSQSPPSQSSSNGDNSQSNNNNNNNNNNSNNNGNNGNNDNNNHSPNNNNNNNNSNSNNSNNNGNNNNNNNNDNDSKSMSSRNKGHDSPPMPPGSKGSSRSSTSAIGDDSSSSSNVPLIAGLVVGIGVLLLILIIVMVVCCKKKKKKKDQGLLDSAQFYNDRSTPQHYSGQHPPWSNPQDMNYSGGTGMSSQWGPAMPPPPPPMMSGDMSGNYSSGPTGPALPPPHPSVALGFNKSTFTYDELAAATSGFSQGNLLGQGGFGFVHKGVLPNGKEIAVKSLKSGSGQGEREFQAEVEIISRVHHRHLVSLVGYCIAGGQRMLVYEFVPNGTLEFHLHGKGRPVMDFPTRMKIALGSAKGLAYLHEDCHPRIIHRDIKTANILIDYSFEAKVADFGLAKLSSDNYTHVSTRVMGTFGYLAPEYAASGKLTEKSDVFSFGVMLLELVTGRRPIDPDEEEDSLVDWARPLIGRAMDEKIFDGLVDPKLEGAFDAQEMMRLIACAGASIRHSGKRRPKMSQIVRALEGDVSLDDLNGAVNKHGSSAGLLSSSSGSDYDTTSYNNDMQRFRRTALNSTDYASSEYGHSSGGESGPRGPSPGPNSRNFL